MAQGILRAKPNKQRRHAFQYDLLRLMNGTPTTVKDAPKTVTFGTVCVHEYYIPQSDMIRSSRRHSYPPRSRQSHSQQRQLDDSHRTIGNAADARLSRSHSYPRSRQSHPHEYNLDAEMSTRQARRRNSIPTNLTRRLAQKRGIDIQSPSSMFSSTTQPEQVVERVSQEASPVISDGKKYEMKMDDIFNSASMKVKSLSRLKMQRVRPAPSNINTEPVVWKETQEILMSA